MKYKLPRQIIKHPNIKEIVDRELERLECLLGEASKKNLKELALVLESITKSGLPDYLVLKKISNKIGHGIFLHPDAKPLTKGQIVGPYSGILSIEVENKEDDSAYAFSLLDQLHLTKEEQKALNSKIKFIPTRKYMLNLDASKVGNFTRFINHSITPNVEAMIMAIPENKVGIEEMPIEVIYVVKKKIIPGEQLLICYEDEKATYWEAYGIEPIAMNPQTYRLDKSLNLIKT